MDVPALRNRPSLAGLAWLWEAYLDLITCRVPGAMSAGSISWLSIQRYAEINGYDGDEIYMLHRVVATLERIMAEQGKKKKS